MLRRVNCSFPVAAPSLNVPLVDSRRTCGLLRFACCRNTEVVVTIVIGIFVIFVVVVQHFETGTHNLEKLTKLSGFVVPT
jgi:hypothetical protein